MPRNVGSEAAASATPQFSERRRHHDEAALARAKEPARLACIELLEALSCNEPKALEQASKAALNAVGLLWETSSRLVP